MGVVGREQRAHVFRVEPLRPGREADEIGEEDCDRLPLLATRAERCVSQRGAAEGAERKRSRQLPTAARAGHPPESRQTASKLQKAHNARLGNYPLTGGSWTERIVIWIGHV